MSRLRGIAGTGKLETTSAENTELCTFKGKDNNFTNPAKFTTFQFMNYTDCTVIVNDGVPVFLPEGMGLQFGMDELIIKSFIVKETAVKYIWVGGY